MTEEQREKVLESALSGNIKVYQEKGRWVVFITGLPEWVNLEFNRSYIPFDIYTSEGVTDYIKLVQQSNY